MSTRTDRWERLTVVLTVFMSQHGQVTDQWIAAQYGRVRMASGGRAMRAPAVWDRIAELLHEEVIKREPGLILPLFTVPIESMTWILEQVSALDEEDTVFRNALARHGLDPDVALDRVMRFHAAQRAMRALTEGGVEHILSSGFGGVVAWMRRGDRKARWTEAELISETGLSPDTVRREIDTARVRGWLRIADSAHGPTYELNIFGQLETSRAMTDMSRASHAFRHLLTTLGIDVAAFFDEDGDQR